MALLMLALREERRVLLQLVWSAREITCGMEKTFSMSNFCEGLRGALLILLGQVSSLSDNAGLENLYPKVFLRSDWSYHIQPICTNFPCFTVVDSACVMNWAQQESVAFPSLPDSLQKDSRISMFLFIPSH